MQLFAARRNDVVMAISSVILAFGTFFPSGCLSIVALITQARANDLLASQNVFFPPWVVW